MKISIIHPSRNRPEMALKTFNNWLNKADFDFEYILSLDIDGLDGYGIFLDALVKRDKNSVTNIGVIIYNNNKSAIDAINSAAKAATSDLFIVVSDDTDCPEHWDTLLLNELKGKSDFCAKVDDGLQPTLVTMPIMDRVYYERYGYIYHPDFLHLHCDEELTCVAIMTGKYIKLPLLFRHMHYSTGLSQKDELNVKNDATWAQGQATLDRHALNNFGIENPVIERKDIIWR